LDVITSDIRRGQYKSAYLLYGEEGFLRDERARELADAVVDKDLQDFNCTEFHGSEVDISSIGSAIMAPPVLSERRVVLIWDLDEFSEDNRKSIARALVRMPDTTVVVIVASTIDQRTTLFKTVSKQGRAVLFRRLYPNQALGWLSGYARSKGIIIDRAASEYLVTVLGTDLSQLAAGVEKAYDYAGIALGKEKRITLEHVRAVVLGTPEFGIFDLVDAIGERNAEKAMSSLRQLMIFQEAPLRILYLIARQVRLILKAKVLKGRKMSSRQIARALGVQEFVAGKCIAQADNFRLEELEDAFSAMIQADIGLKTSGSPDHVILERLALHLCDGPRC
jgi:DNA polymerase-3 subunit delta